MKKIIKLVSIILIVATFISACDKNDNHKRRHRRNRGDSCITLSNEPEIYTFDYIVDKMDATSTDDSRFFNNECKRISSENIYNNSVVMLFDSKQEASDFYSDAVNNYITSITQSGDNYVCGWEYGVCDASIEIMILYSKNMVMITTVQFVGEPCEPDVYSYTCPYLGDSDIEQISSDWL